MHGHAKKAVSHSADAAVISLDAGLVRPSRRDPSRQLKPQTLKSTQESIDYVPPNVPESSDRAHLMMFEDTEAVIKMIIKGHSPHLRHVSRTHRVDLD